MHPRLRRSRAATRARNRAIAHARIVGTRDALRGWHVEPGGIDGQKAPSPTIGKPIDKPDDGNKPPFPFPLPKLPPFEDPRRLPPGFA